MKIEPLKLALVDILTQNLVPMVTGPPGIGKSELIRWIAKKFNLFIIDLRLSQCDPTDLLGFPGHDNKRMFYRPPDHFPLEGDPIPKGYNGWILFLDEFNSATQAVQAAAYKLVLDRLVGLFKLHSRCAIVCAGNGEGDAAIVNRLGTAMQSRLIHVAMQVDPKAWAVWATENDLDHRAISYVEGHPDHLHKFDPNHNDKTFACPRTWEFAAKLIKGKDTIPEYLLETLEGTLSAGIARQFHAYIEYYSELPKLEDILKTPDDIEIPVEPAELYAISHMVAAYLDKDTAKPLMRFIDRLPLEFGTTATRATLRRNKELLKIDDIRNWAHKVAADIF